MFVNSIRMICVVIAVMVLQAKPTPLFSIDSDSLKVLLQHQHTVDTNRVALLLQLSQALRSEEKWRPSLPYLLEAHKICTQLKNIKGCMYAQQELFKTYYELGVFDSAGIYNEYLLKLAQQFNSEIFEMRAWNNKANLFSYNLKQDSAIEAYQEAYRLADRLEDKKSQATYSSNMGIIFGQQGQYDKARNYFREALDLGYIIKDSTLIVLGSMNIAKAFTKEKVFDSAHYYLNIAQQAAANIEDPSMLYGVKDFKGYLALEKGDLEEAEILYKSLQDIYQQNQQKVALAGVYSKLANIAYHKFDYDLAVNYAFKSLQLLENKPTNELKEEVLLVLANSYHRKGNDRMAFQFSEQYRKLRDSTYNQEVASKVAEMESRYDLAKKEKENAELTLETQRQDRRRTTSFLVMGIIATFVASILFFLYQENQLKKKLNLRLEATVQDRTAALQASNHKLQKYNDELRTFGHITSHDLKEPLRNISGFVSLLEKKLKPKLDTESLEFMAFIKKNTSHMHQLIEDVLSYSTVEDTPIDLTTIDLMKTMAKVEFSLHSIIEDARAKVLYQNLPSIISNEGRLFLMLKNLVENGIKYNQSATPRVRLCYQSNQLFHHITVEDNGIGIPPEYQARVFQLFKRLHNRSVYSGTGMGLAISQKMADQLGGRIEIKKSDQNGSIFVLSLPKSPQLFPET